MYSRGEILEADDCISNVVPDDKLAVLQHQNVSIEVQSACLITGWSVCGRNAVRGDFAYCDGLGGQSKIHPLLSYLLMAADGLLT